MKRSNALRRLTSSLLAVGSLTFAEPAAAHAMLERASPPVGGATGAPPTELRLRFSEAVEPAFSQIGLAGTDGGAISLGPVGLDPADARTLVAPILAPLAPGLYRVRWRAVSRDTHTTTGDFTFRVGP